MIKQAILYLHFPFFFGRPFFFVGHKTPYPPSRKYPAHSVSLAQGAVQKLGAGMGNLLDRYQEVAEAAWIAYDQNHQKKTTIQGQTGKDDDENEWTLCEFEDWNAFVSKKKIVIFDLWMNVR